MKKYIAALGGILLVSNLNAEVEVLKKIVVVEDICSVKVTADCDHDGVAELTSIVDCEHADEMKRQFQAFCDSQP